MNKCFITLILLISLTCNSIAANNSNRMLSNNTTQQNTGNKDSQISVTGEGLKLGLFDWEYCLNYLVSSPIGSASYHNISMSILPVTIGKIRIKLISMDLIVQPPSYLIDFYLQQMGAYYDDEQLNEQMSKYVGENIILGMSYTAGMEFDIKRNQEKDTVLTGEIGIGNEGFIHAKPTDISQVTELFSYAVFSILLRTAGEQNDADWFYIHAGALIQVKISYIAKPYNLTTGIKISYDKNDKRTLVSLYAGAGIRF